MLLLWLATLSFYFILYFTTFSCLFLYGRSLSVLNKLANRLRENFAETSATRISLPMRINHKVDTLYGLAMRWVSFTKQQLVCRLSSSTNSSSPAWNTVKPLYSGHHRDLKKSFIKRCPLHRGCSKIDLFYFKNLL